MLRRALDFLIYSSLFIAGCAVLMAHQTALLFHLRPPPALYAYVFCGTVCSYNFHWWLKPPQNAPGPRVASRISQKLHAILAAVALLVAGIASIFLLKHWPWLASTVAPAFLYSAPKISHPLFAGLRRIAVGKTVFLAAAWTHVTVTLPLLVGQSSLPTASLFFANRFFFIYAVCIIFDRRDVEEDRKAGIKSLVTYLRPNGVHALFWISLALTLFTGFWLVNPLGFWPVILLCLPAAAVGLLYRASLRATHDYFYYLLLDGLMAASAPLLILATFAR